MTAKLTRLAQNSVNATSIGRKPYYMRFSVLVARAGVSEYAVV